MEHYLAMKRTCGPRVPAGGTGRARPGAGYFSQPRRRKNHIGSSALTTISAIAQA